MELQHQSEHGDHKDRDIIRIPKSSYQALEIWKSSQCKDLKIYANSFDSCESRCPRIYIENDLRSNSLIRLVHFLIATDNMKIGYVKSKIGRLNGPRLNQDLCAELSSMPLVTETLNHVCPRLQAYSA
jgi:hypothetical protein